MLIDAPPPERLGEHVFQDRQDAKPLDSLGAPISSDLARMHSPYFLGVVLEKHLIKRPSETVDIEILKRGLRKLVERRDQISPSNADRVPQTHPGECRPLDGDGIIKEMAQEKDAGHPVPDKHHPILFLRIGTSFDDILVPAEQYIVKSG